MLSYIYKYVNRKDNQNFRLSQKLYFGRNLILIFKVLFTYLNNSTHYVVNNSSTPMNEHYPEVLNLSKKYCSFEINK